MDRTKIVPLLFLVIIAGLGLIAYKFYSENQILVREKSIFERERADLTEKNNQLSEKYNALEAEKKDLESRKSELEATLTRLEAERGQWQKKAEDLSREKDILAQRLSGRPTLETLRTEEGQVKEAPSGDYWEDFVKTKAELEAKVDGLQKELMDTKSKSIDMEREKSELNMVMDELNKKRVALEQELKFKERTISIMSRDLVNEREGRRGSLKDSTKLQEEVMNLKRDLVLANKERVRLQNELNSATEERNDLESQLSEIKNILREKSLALEELQEQLAQTIGASKVVTAPKEPAFIELPPIVVKPEASTVEPKVSAVGKDLKGEVIAVNTEEKFVIVDIGQTLGVSPGLELKIIRGDKEIAVVEVIEARKEISAADIKEVFDSSGIKEGDIAISK